MKRKALIIAALLLVFIFISLFSYFIGMKFGASSENKEKINTNLTPTVTPKPTLTATESLQISPTAATQPLETVTPEPTAINTPTPTKLFKIPNIRLAATPTPTPTPKPIFQIPNIRTK